MKKLLSLIGALTLVGTASAPVIACGTKNNVLSQVDKIKAKITDVDLTVPDGTNRSTSNAQTIQAIKTALKANNLTLTTSDLRKITFKTVTLVAGQAKALTSTITIGQATATKILNVTLAQTDQQKANAIRDKISDVALTVPAGINPNTGIAGTVTAIKTALEANNTSLSTTDLAKIAFNSVTLVSGQSKNVTVTIRVGTGAQAGSATKTLNVTLAQTDKQKANAIKEKITDVDLSVSNRTNRSTSNAQTIQAIKTSLKTANQSLTTADLTKITFNSTMLSQEVAKPVTATITVGAGSLKSTATKTLNVIIAQRQWTQSTSIPSDTNVDAAPVKIGSTYYLSTYGKGLYTSSNGSTWTQSTGAGGIPTDANLWAAPVEISGTYYLSTYGKGLYTSTNGSTWTQSTGIPTDRHIRVAPDKIGNTYYLGTYSNGLYTSTDGSIWTRAAATGIPTDTYIYVAPVKIGNTYYLGAEGHGLYTSTDGSTWTRAAASGIPTDANIESAPIKIGNTYYLGTDGKGLYTSTDGSSWTQSTSIPTDANIQSAPIKIGNTYYLGTDDKGLYTSTDGSTWTQSTRASGGIPTNARIYSAPVKIGDTYYLATANLGLYTS